MSSPTVTTRAPADDDRGPSVARILGGLLVALVVLSFATVAAALLLSHGVSGNSMLPTVRTGDRLLVLPGHAGQVERLGLAVMTEPRSDNIMVKRVIAVAGDRVQVRVADGAHEVLVQLAGQGPWFRVDQPTWADQSASAGPCCGTDGKGTTQPSIQVVPDGRIFVLGDNPDGSTDSRKFGWIDVATVTGTVTSRIWPLERFGDPGNPPTLTEVPAPAGA